MGVAALPVGMRVLHSSAPVSMSNARKLWSPEPAMNTRPEAVTVGPPTPGVPRKNQNGNGAMSRVVPRGTLHSFAPLARSMASSVFQGGAVQGSPQGDSRMSGVTQKGVPSCGCAVGCLSQAWRGMRWMIPAK